jgi:hypothetical protein
VAITDRTLAQAAALRDTVGGVADDATRTLTAAWVKAWDDLTGQWRTATADITARQAELGRYPYPWELSRLATVQQALRATEQQLVVLGQHANAQITDAAGNAVAATVEREPHIIASQLPAALVTAAVTLYTSRLTTHTVDAVNARIGHGIAALTRPIARSTYDAVQREVARGIPAAASQGMAARLAGRFEAAFNGGLSRAVTVVRTETVDAYRTVAQASHRANQDVVAGWVWNSRLAATTCPACWAMHGTEHPVTEAGPDDHRSGRCGRLPLLRSWRDLGIDLPEPASAVPNAEAAFDALPEADQLAIMGPVRLELLRSGRARWGDLAIRRDSPNWRPSYTPRPVADLQRLAAQPV